MTLRRHIARSHLLSFCLVFGAITVPIIQSTAAVAPTIIKAFRAKGIPIMDGMITSGEWEDTFAFKEPVTRAAIAFKHDGENLYLLAFVPSTGS